MKLFTKAIENALKKFPYGSQDGKGENAKVIARFFGGSAFTCYILEDEGDGIFYGLVNIGYGFEYGSISRAELESLRFPPFGLPVERDSSVDPLKKTLGECMKVYGEKLM